MMCFRGKVVLFIARSYFYGIFSDFQRLVRVRSASMTNTKPSRGVVCHYCHNPRHVRQNCRKLQNKNRRFQSVHHQKSLQSASTSISTLVESGKTNACLISSSSTWVIDSGATDHMTSNSSLFTTFQSLFYLYCYPCRWVNILCPWVRDNSSNSSNHFDLCYEFTTILF